MLISTSIGNTSHKVQNPFMIKYQTGSIKDFDKRHLRADIVLLYPFPLMERVGMFSFTSALSCVGGPRKS